MKSNNRTKIREACRVTANYFRKEDDFLLEAITDAKAIVKNHPEDVKAYINKLSSFLDVEAFIRIGGTESIMNRLPTISQRPECTYLCVYDFYKALRDCKYFSVERALKRIKQFGVRHPIMTYTRKNARGHWTSAASPNRKAYTQSFCSEFNYNWRMILSLGSRLAKGDDRCLTFKANGIHLPYIESKMVEGTDSKFTIRCSINSTAIAQMDLFLQAMTPGIFTYTRHGHVFYIEVKQASKIQVPELTLEQKEVIKGELSVDNSKEDFLKIYRPDLVSVEEHFYKEMEKSVNEMTTIVDDYDRQIDELTGKADKIRAQRSKLLHAMQELRK